MFKVVKSKFFLIFWICLESNNKKGYLCILRGTRWYGVVERAGAVS